MTVRLAANISWMFTEWDFLSRIDHAALAGFSAVECMFPYESPPAEVRARLDATGVQCVLFTVPAGDWDHGERGLAALTDRHDEFRSGVERALEYAGALGCPRLHVMAGVSSLDDTEVRATYLANLRYAADRGADHSVVTVIEAINHVDMPGYALWTVEQAVQVIVAVDHPNLRLQLDLYHHQMEGGDPVDALDRYRSLIEHIQVAGVPGRHEPDDGRFPIDAVMRTLGERDYEGAVGCEYRPRTDTTAGLGWARPYLEPR